MQKGWEGCQGSDTAEQGFLRGAGPEAQARLREGRLGAELGPHVV